MALAVANRDGGKTSERGFFDGLRSLVTGNVISGFRVRENSPLAMSVRIGGEYNSTTGANRDSALIDDGIRAYEVFTDDGAAITASVGAAHASLPRLDTAVVYIDKAQARVTTVLDNINGVVKAKVVAGTPGSSPTAPSASTIQASIGAGNPYFVVGDVSVPAAVTQIQSSNITDKRVMAMFDLSRIAGGTTAGVLTTNASGDVSVGAKTTDANGWTVYDYGAWKEYTKRFSGLFAQEIPASGAVYFTTPNLPVGVSNLASAHIDVSAISGNGTDASIFSVVKSNNIASDNVASTAIVLELRNTYSAGPVQSGYWTLYVTMRI